MRGFSVVRTSSSFCVWLARSGSLVTHKSVTRESTKRRLLRNRLQKPNEEIISFFKKLSQLGKSVAMKVSMLQSIKEAFTQNIQEV